MKCFSLPWNKQLATSTTKRKGLEIAQSCRTGMQRAYDTTSKMKQFLKTERRFDWGVWCRRQNSIWAYFLSIIFFSVLHRRSDSTRLTTNKKSFISHQHVYTVNLPIIALLVRPHCLPVKPPPLWRVPREMISTMLKHFRILFLPAFESVREIPEVPVPR